uniref:PBS lyase HEAT-like repeat-containing protein n=1 Tax=Candidatus Kentrum sp. DK TaxID=2126562 RepID=A0A450SAI7_9GAMM|nr:MAG: PBS lyase HEAT-like repeat-containing protein [Candidatus Kentron sp. DK]
MPEIIQEIIQWSVANPALAGLVIAFLALIVAVLTTAVTIHYGKKQTKKPKPPLALEARYRQIALDACDIVDLANLPEDDRHLATRSLELRRLYVALRLEIKAGDEPDDETLKSMEKRRARSTGNWGGAGHQQDDEENPVSLGERLQAVRRLVVLGDPGAGKSTLLRWLATAYLLRLKSDPAFADFPDIESLPDGDLLPILVRCRDLPPDTHTLEAMLLETLKKSQLPEAECAELGELLRTRLAKGEALLLVDGLDEITEPGARARFSEQMEKIHTAYPKAPLVVTSRIVGYREMGYRIRSGFEHLTVAELSRDDKDQFARRWCALTETASRREATAEELIRDIRSSDRIERLTGNPMLLTTMALIKRKIGRLPQRRVDLYEKAVEVLLNWRNQVDTPLDPREALPQLEYLAHAMCEKGIQQIREDEILELLHQVRADYPNIHPLEQHTPEEFLHLLEARAGLLIQSGHRKHDGRSTPVYEFRHLTFQEYLAGLALVQGHYRGWSRERSLAQAVAPLAGQVGEKRWEGDEDTAVVENWREALRLCVAACNDSEVEEVLRAILTPLSSRQGTSSRQGSREPASRDGFNTHSARDGNQPGTERARAVLAALCLADEPNVGEQLAREVLQQLAAQVGENDGGGFVDTSLDAAALEAARSRWGAALADYLLDEFLQREAAARGRPGELYGLAWEAQLPSAAAELARWLAAQALRLPTCEEREATGIALAVAYLAFRDRDCRAPGLVEGLIGRLTGGAASSPGAALTEAAAWALFGMNRVDPSEHRWHPTPAEQRQLIAAADRPDGDGEALYWLSEIFGNERMAGAVDALLRQLAAGYRADTRQAMVEALGQIGDPRAVDALAARLADAGEDKDVRLAAAVALGQIGDPDPRAVEPLVARLADAGEDKDVRRAVAEALGQIGEEPALAALRACLDDPVEAARRAALGGLAQTCKDQIDRRLLFANLYGFGPGLDPRQPIDTARMEQAARILKKPLPEIRRRYGKLAEEFGLKLAE